MAQTTPADTDTADQPLSSVPLDLYKANVGLQLNISRLLQDSSHAWLNAFGQLRGESLEESTQQLQNLMQAASWQQLATLPTESFWRMMQGHMGESQALSQMALQSQIAFADHLQQALIEWRQQVAQALDAGQA